MHVSKVDINYVAWCTLYIMYYCMRYVVWYLMYVEPCTVGCCCCCCCCGGGGGGGGGRGGCLKSLASVVVAVFVLCPFENWLFNGKSATDTAARHRLPLPKKKTVGKAVAVDEADSRNLTKLFYGVAFWNIPGHDGHQVTCSSTVHAVKCTKLLNWCMGGANGSKTKMVKYVKLKRKQSSDPSMITYQMH